MIPARLRRYMDREVIRVQPIGDQFRAYVDQDDQLLFMGKLWEEISDAAEEAEEAYVAILDERHDKAMSERESWQRETMVRP